MKKLWHAVEASGSNRNWTLPVMNKATPSFLQMDKKKELVSMEDLTNKLQSKVNARR